MKKLAALSYLLSLCIVTEAEDAKTNSPVTIPASEAKTHAGANAIVTGKIVEVNKAEKLVRLNFDKPFPKQPFTVVVFSSKTNLFPDLEQLKGKNVEVSGKITEYRDRPQIVMDSTNQLKVVEKAADLEQEKK